MLPRGDLRRSWRPGHATPVLANIQPERHSFGEASGTCLKTCRALLSRVGRVSGCRPGSAVRRMPLKGAHGFAVRRVPLKGGCGFVHPPAHTPSRPTPPTGPPRPSLKVLSQNMYPFIVISLCPASRPHCRCHVTGRDSACFSLCIAAVQPHRQEHVCSQCPRLSSDFPFLPPYLPLLPAFILIPPLPHPSLAPPPGPPPSPLPLLPPTSSSRCLRPDRKGVPCAELAHLSDSDPFQGG